MSAGKKFPIYAKTLTGSNTEISVQATDTVLALKHQLRDKLGVNIIRLIHNGKDLEDAKPLGESDVREEAIIIVITESEMPCHFFFALDESGSMSGGRWGALMQSFVEFVDQRHESAKKNDIPIQDRVSVIFHETHARVASCRKTSGEVVPFDNIPLTEIDSSSLINDFKSGGNNFDHALRFLTPFLEKSVGFTPVLMFMTDGGDCGDDAPPGNFRQRAYDRMADIKKKIPNLRVYVTSVFTTCVTDIDGAKKLCAAAGMDVSTNYNHIEDDGSAHKYSSAPTGGPMLARNVMTRRAPSYAPSALLDDDEAACEEYSPVAPMPSVAPSPFPAGVPSYAAVPVSSAQRKMASHWNSVYCANSLQAPK